MSILRRDLPLICIVILLGLLPARAATSTTGNIQVTVQELNSKPAVAVANAAVTVLKTSFAATTDQSGKATVSGLAPGAYTVQVTHPSYETTTINVYVKGGGTEGSLVTMKKKPRARGDR